MKRKQKQKIKQQSQFTCPSCQQIRNRKDLGIISELLQEARQQNEFVYNSLAAEVSFSALKNQEFDWACDHCIEGQLALLAQPLQQNFCWNPHLAYTNTEKTCENCGRFYLFRKEEKKHWYETLKFWYESEPLHCPECRKTIRVERRDNTRLSELLRHGPDQLSLENLREVVAIYERMEKPERTKYFAALVRKKQQG